jgi:uncharacterized Rmd1/YagE family protein
LIELLHELAMHLKKASMQQKQCDSMLSLEKKKDENRKSKENQKCALSNIFSNGVVVFFNHACCYFGSFIILQFLILLLLR